MKKKLVIIFVVLATAIIALGMASSASAEVSKTRPFGMGYCTIFVSDWDNETGDPYTWAWTIDFETGINFTSSPFMSFNEAKADAKLVWQNMPRTITGCGAPLIPLALCLVTSHTDPQTGGATLLYSWRIVTNDGRNIISYREWDTYERAQASLDRYVFNHWRIVCS